MNNNKTLKEIIKDLLLQYPATRDYDIELYKVYLQKKFPASYHRLTVIRLFDCIREGSIHNYDTVSRCRRKLQEENDSLKGNVYDERQRLGEIIRKDIGIYGESNLLF